MDTILERILDLLPKTESGKIVHGAKKDLADAVGLPHNIVAEWISGRNRSYLKYLPVIAHRYNSSVAYLLGESDQKNNLEKDITLERILSLIPKKPDGKYIHGAFKEFASKVGLKSGNLVSDWIAGRSMSYQGYVYQIAAIYNVSPDWLQGKTDKKNPAAREGNGWENEAIQLLKALSPDQLDRELAYLRELAGDQDT